MRPCPCSKGCCRPVVTRWCVELFGVVHQCCMTVYGCVHVPMHTSQGAEDMTTAHVHELLASALQAPAPLQTRRWWGGRASSPCRALQEAVQHRQASLECRAAAYGARSVAAATGHAGVAAAWLLVASNGCGDDEALQRCVVVLDMDGQLQCHTQGTPSGNDGVGHRGRGVGGCSEANRPAVVDAAVAALSGHRATTSGAMDDGYGAVVYGCWKVTAIARLGVCKSAGGAWLGAAASGRCGGERCVPGTGRLGAAGGAHAQGAGGGRSGDGVGGGARNTVDGCPIVFVAQRVATHWY